MRSAPVIALLTLTACGGQVSSEEEAEMAYLGLDAALSRAMDLGFDGFNAADSANIPPQAAEGDSSGTMTISGQVDQGASDNKGMRLEIALDNYQDVVDLDEDEDSELSVTYWTDPDQELPAFDLQLRDIPSGTVAGTLSGTFAMEGDLEGDVLLEVSITGELEESDDGGTQRKPGTVTVSGTATGPQGGVFEVEVAL